MFSKKKKKKTQKGLVTPVECAVLFDQKKIFESILFE